MCDLKGKAMQQMMQDIIKHYSGDIETNIFYNKEH